MNFLLYYHPLRYNSQSWCPVEVSNFSNLKLGYNSIKLENETAEVSDLPFSETDPHFLFLFSFSVKEMNMVALAVRANACRPEYDSKITTGAQPMHVRGEF